MAVGLFLGALVLAAPAPDGLTPEGQRVAAVALVMAIWWLFAIFPLSITALVPIVAFPLLGVASITETAAPYAHPLIFLCLGGFILGAALEQAGFHDRLTVRLLSVPAFRVAPRRVLAVLMGVAALVSALVSNTATAVMMMPLALMLAGRCGLDSRARSGFALGLAYACSIGGVSTLVGTFPNAVLVQVAQVEAGLRIGFAQWMLVGAVFSLGALPVAWWLVSVRMIPAIRDTPDVPEAEAWRPGQRVAIGVVALTMVAWLTRQPLVLGVVTVPGWGTGLALDDAWVAVAAVFVLFAIRGEQGASFLDFKEMQTRIPWAVLFLLGGGFALADGIKSSGLTEWLAQGTMGLAALPVPAAALAICVVVTFLTELTSNTATTQVLLPVLAAGAMASGVDPVAWMVPATISASCAFMLPVATPPNAVAAESGNIAPADMARVGLRLNLVLAVWATVVGAYWAPFIWSIGPG